MVPLLLYILSPIKLLDITKHWSKGQAEYYHNLFLLFHAVGWWSSYDIMNQVGASTQASFPQRPPPKFPNHYKVESYTIPFKSCSNVSICVSTLLCENWSHIQLPPAFSSHLNAPFLSFTPNIVDLFNLAVVMPFPLHRSNTNEQVQTEKPLLYYAFDFELHFCHYTLRYFWLLPNISILTIYEGYGLLLINMALMHYYFEYKIFYKKRQNFFLSNYFFSRIKFWYTYKEEAKIKDRFHFRRVLKRIYKVLVLVKVLADDTDKSCNLKQAQFLFHCLSDNKKAKANFSSLSQQDNYSPGKELSSWINCKIHIHFNWLK